MLDLLDKDLTSPRPASERAVLMKNLAIFSRHRPALARSRVQENERHSLTPTLHRQPKTITGGKATDLRFWAKVLGQRAELLDNIATRLRAQYPLDMAARPSFLFRTPAL